MSKLAYCPKCKNMKAYSNFSMKTVVLVYIVLSVIAVLILAGNLI